MTSKKRAALRAARLFQKDIHSCPSFYCRSYLTDRKVRLTPRYRTLPSTCCFSLSSASKLVTKLR